MADKLDLLRPEVIATLPPEVQQRLRQKTEDLMSDLGVRCLVDQETGERSYNAQDIADALGFGSIEEMQRIMEQDGYGDAMKTVPGDRLKPPQ